MFPFLKDKRTKEYTAPVQFPDKSAIATSPDVRLAPRLYYMGYTQEQVDMS
jgi:heam-based aerotactic trancducer